MNSDVKILARDLLSELNWLLFEEIKFEEEVFIKYGTSTFDIQLAKELPEDDCDRASKLIAAEENYQKLISSVAQPGNEECIWLLSFAHTLTCRLVEGRIADYPDRLHPMNMLIEASVMMGKALSIIHAPSLVFEAQNYYKDNQRKPQSTGGKKGAQSKHALTNKMKLWAVKESEDKHRIDKEFANNLAKNVPGEFIGASVDPARFIYDSIRKAAEEKKNILSSNI